MVDIENLHRLVTEAATAHTVEDQVQRIVQGVQRAMQVDVCSLYRVDTNDALRLVANVGFDEGAAGTVTLRVGEGLVGTIASEQRVINIDNASSHPAFKPIEGIGEEAFESFLGVPVLNLRRSIGVLVVQSAENRRFLDTEAAFLVTVAAQLSGTLLHWSPPSRANRSRTVTGVSGAPGKAIGNVHLIIDSRLLQYADTASDGTDAATETGRLENAVLEVRAMMRDARTRLEPSVSSDVLALFDFYNLLLDGDELVRLIQNRIALGQTAIASTRAAVDELMGSFETIADPYLRARSDDIRHIGDKLSEVLLAHEQSTFSPSGDVVLLGNLVSVTDIARVEPGALRGVVCMEGSSLSHTAVVARALGVPAVMGVGAIDHLSENQRIVVDGDAGTVILEPAESLVRSYRSVIDGEVHAQRELDALKDLPAVTTDGFRVHLLANTGLLHDVAIGRSRGAEGVGLFRSELPFMATQRFPTEDEQYELYRRLLVAYHPLPVTMRTLDLGGDKQLPYLEIKEENPALGWRGIRFTLDNRPIFLGQLRAMLRADDGLGNLRIMLPMVSHLSDVVEARSCLSAAAEDLRAEGVAVAMPPIGIMVEVPGVIALMRHLTGLIDFLSIGTNDLTQYLLAVDRANVRVASRYDHLHPAVLRTVLEIVDTARQLDIPVSVCGEMASDPAAVVLLVGMRVATLSMNSFSLGKVKRVIRGIDLGFATDALAGALAGSDAVEIRASVEQALAAQLGGQTTG